MKKSTTQLLATALVAAAAYTLLPTSKPRLRPGQVALVTGGSRGLGLAIATRFAEAGLKLVLAARSADDLELARDQILRTHPHTHEDDILLVACDLTDPNQCGSLIDQALTAFGQLDVLVNNAGIIEVGPLEDQSLSAYERAMATNFFAALYTTHAALPHMLQRRAGAIVNISSIGGKVAVPHMLPYSAAKFALTGFSEGLYVELRAKGVRVTTVCPGLMRTGGEAHAQFTGNVEAEKQWFNLAAKTPGIAVTAAYAASRIFAAVNAGRAEITISPQAWLMARTQGLLPETTQFALSLVNQHLLPAPVHAAPQTSAPHIHQDEESEADPSPS